MNCSCCVMSLYRCLPVSRLGVPTALELGEKLTFKKKRGTALILHIQMWWEKKHQFLSLDHCHSYGFETTMFLSPYKLPAYPQVMYAIPLSVRALQCHSHIPQIASLLPNNAILLWVGDVQSRVGNSQRGKRKLAHKVPADSALI